jgi:hypothetical protein
MILLVIASCPKDEYQDYNHQNHNRDQRSIIHLDLKVGFFIGFLLKFPMSRNVRPATMFLCEQDNYSCLIQEVKKYGGCPVCLMRRKMQAIYISEWADDVQTMDISENEFTCSQNVLPLCVQMERLTVENY